MKLKEMDELIGAEDDAMFQLSEEQKAAAYQSVARRIGRITGQLNDAILDAATWAIESAAKARGITLEDVQSMGYDNFPEMIQDLDEWYEVATDIALEALKGEISMNFLFPINLDQEA